MSLDLILVGGGLANGLLAYRLAQLRPDLPLLVIEGEAQPGGNHTWSFHESDLTSSEAAWLDAFVVHRWSGYDVNFPGLSRRVDIGYRSVSSARFAEVLTKTLGGRLRCNIRASRVAPQCVILENGEEIRAGAVVDGRGPAETTALQLAYQKFLGLEVLLDNPHELERPILMDGTVDQLEGYRFLYVLPLAPDRLLIEDTYYAEAPGLDTSALRSRIEAYAAARGWRIREVVREEAGVLPITLAGKMDTFWNEGVPGLPRTGLRAALFHPTTGYSLPDAVRLADHLAVLPDLSAASLYTEVRAWSVRRWRSHGFFRLLNRMLFRAGEPSERFRVLSRFYRLPEPTIRRFYAGALSPFDKVRLLAGKPPVPVMGALRAMLPELRLQR